MQCYGYSMGIRLDGSVVQCTDAGPVPVVVVWNETDFSEFCIVCVAMVFPAHA